MLDELGSIVMSNSSDHVLVLGDLNALFPRNSPHTSAVQQAFDELNLQLLWESHVNLVKYNVTHTYISVGNNRSTMTVLDHFALSPDLLAVILDAGTVDAAENISDHLPIFLKLDISMATAFKESPPTSRVNLSKASPEQVNLFKNHLANAVLSLQVPDALNCTDTCCKSTEHNKQL